MCYSRVEHSNMLVVTEAYFWTVFKCHPCVRSNWLTYLQEHCWNWRQPTLITPKTNSKDTMTWTQGTFGTVMRVSGGQIKKTNTGSCMLIFFQTFSGWEAWVSRIGAMAFVAARASKRSNKTQNWNKNAHDLEAAPPLFLTSRQTFKPSAKRLENASHNRSQKPSS